MNMQGLHYDLDSLFPENPDFLREEEICLKDFDNIKRLYPTWTKWLSVYVDEYIDRYEYEGSPIYNEYPDEVTVYAMAEDIYYMMADNMESAIRNTEESLDNGDAFASDRGRNAEDDGYIFDIIRIMVCNTIYLRRRRHDRFCRCHKFRQKDYMKLS